MKKTVALLCLLAGMGSAEASTYQFTLSGFDSASFTIASDPVPLQTLGTSFVTSDVFGSFSSPNGLSASSAKLRFFSLMSGGGSPGGGGFTAFFPNTTDFTTSGGIIFDTTGALLFSGSASSPSFVPGQYSLTNAMSGGSDTLVVSDAGPMPVPEPPSWAVALFGAVAAGYAVRRRTRA